MVFLWLLTLSALIYSVYRVFQAQKVVDFKYSNLSKPLEEYYSENLSTEKIKDISIQILAKHFNCPTIKVLENYQSKLIYKR